MRDRFNNLNLREKQIISLGLFILIIALIYFLLWSPLDSAVTALRTQIRSDQGLLTWMQNADQQIRSLEKIETVAPSSSQRSLLGILQNAINETPLAKNVKQLHQMDVDSVQMVFENVNFDELMTWLIHMTKQENLMITQMIITPMNRSGLVHADLILK